MRAAHDIPDQTAATAWPLAAYHVPYLEDGFIDWSQVDSDLSAPESDEESEVELLELDSSSSWLQSMRPFARYGTGSRYAARGQTVAAV